MGGRASAGAWREPMVRCSTLERPHSPFQRAPPVGEGPAVPIAPMADASRRRSGLRAEPGGAAESRRAPRPSMRPGEPPCAAGCSVAVVPERQPYSFEPARQNALQTSDMRAVFLAACLALLVPAAASAAADVGAAADRRQLCRRGQVLCAGSCRGASFFNQQRDHCGRVGLGVWRAGRRRQARRAPGAARSSAHRVSRNAHPPAPPYPRRQCNHPCPGTQACVQGQCVCPQGTVWCKQACRTTNTNDHCGRVSGQACGAPRSSVRYCRQAPPSFQPRIPRPTAVWHALRAGPQVPAQPARTVDLPAAAADAVSAPTSPADGWIPGRPCKL